MDEILPSKLSEDFLIITIGHCSDYRGNLFSFRISLTYFGAREKFMPGVSLPEVTDTGVAALLLVVFK